MSKLRIRIEPTDPQGSQAMSLLREAALEARRLMPKLLRLSLALTIGIDGHRSEATFRSRMEQSEPFDQASFRRAKATGLPQEGAMTITKNLGMLVLAIYLICVGLVGLAGLSLGIIPAILAIVAGVLILIGR